MELVKEHRPWEHMSCAANTRLIDKQITSIMKKKKIKNAFFEIGYISLYVIINNTTTEDLLIFYISI